MIEYPYASLSELWLCNVPWNPTYNDVYLPLGKTFEERKAKAKTTMEKIKNDGVHYDKIQPIRNELNFTLKISYNDAKKYNYCIYIDKDSRFSKNGEPVEMYCFIGSINQVNDSLTSFVLIPDYFTLFYTMNKTNFVGRQQIARKHVINDTIGVWREPENYEPYRYVSSNEQYLTEYGDNETFGMNNLIPVLFCTSVEDIGLEIQDRYKVFCLQTNADGTNLNLCHTIIMHTFEYNESLDVETDEYWDYAIEHGRQLKTTEFSDIIKKFDDISSVVLCIKSYPKQLITKWISNRASNIKYGELPVEPFVLKADVDYNDFFEHDYHPINSKCYQFPCIMAKVMNNQNELQSFRLEDYNDSEKDSQKRTITPKWVVNGDVSPNGTCIAYPEGYGTNNWWFNFNYPITIGTLPTGSWVTDTYKAWLSQQGGENALKSINALQNDLVDNGTNTSINQYNFQVKQIGENAKYQENQYKNSYGSIKGGWQGNMGENNTVASRVATYAPSVGSLVGATIGAGVGVIAGPKAGALLGPAIGTLGSQAGNFASAWGSREVDITSMANTVGYAQGLYDVTSDFASVATNLVIGSGNLQKRLNNEQLNATLKGAKTMNDGYVGGQTSTLASFNGIGFYFEVDTFSKQDIVRFDHYLSEWGYAVNGIMPVVNDNCNPLISHQKFNYVEMIDCMMKSEDFAIEEETRVLETIFNNGVRVWHNIEDLEGRNIYQVNPPVDGMYDNIIGVDT